MTRRNTLIGLCSLCLLIGYLLTPMPFTQGSGGDDDDNSTLPKQQTFDISKDSKDWVYGEIEFLHDIQAPDKYHMKLLGHPESKIPKIIGGYAFTDVGVNVKLRGVDAPRALQDAEDLHRPLKWRKRERERWNEAMGYMWNLTDTNHTFRLHNLKKLDEKTVEADIEFYLGGQWNNLAVSMLHDEIMRPLGQDDWDPGSRNYGLESPSVPR